VRKEGNGREGKGNHGKVAEMCDAVVLTAAIVLACRGIALRKSVKRRGEDEQTDRKEDGRRGWEKKKRDKGAIGEIVLDITAFTTLCKHLLQTYYTTLQYATLHFTVRYSTAPHCPALYLQYCGTAWMLAVLLRISLPLICIGLPLRVKSYPEPNRGQL
jgi:hypothetical protein